MLFKKDELKYLGVFYLTYFIHGLAAVIWPFFIIYFRDLGFSFFQIAFMTSAFGISLFLFEVPTGAVADGWSRKNSVFLGLLIGAVSIILIPFFKAFIPILIMWILLGLGTTFISGAEEAWIIDNLNHYKKKDLIPESYIKGSSIMGIGFIFAPLIAAFLVKSYSMNILWYVFGGGLALIAFIQMFFIKEMYKPKKIKLKNVAKETINNSKKGFKFTFRHRTVFLLTIGGLFAALMTLGENGWQPFMIEVGLPTPSLGVVYSILGIVMVIVPYLSKLFSKMKVKKALALMTLIRMILLVSVIIVLPPLYALAAMLYILSFGMRGLRDPIMRPYLHKFIPKKIRATVVSVQSMIFEISFALLALVAGVLMDITGPQKIIALSGLFGIFAIITYMKIKD